MSESVLLRIHRGSVQALAEVVQSWTNPGVRATLAREVEEAVRLCLRWPEEFQELWESLWRRAAASEIEDYQATGEQFVNHLDHALRILDTVRERIREQQQQGRALASAAKLETVHAELHRLRHHAQERWPWINETIIQEALAEYERGEYRSVREILDELQGTSP